jgi:predicted unusual protein kinase regulating ubiquinone biosynthesis (AarF/ABC1/UbiB family)
MKKDIPSSKLKRSGVAALAAAKVGARQLSHLSKRPFLSKQQKEEQTLTTDTANADVIFKALVQLRGTALKVAQMLSMETDLLPEKYRQELAKSYYQVPPLNRALIRKEIECELGGSPESIFKAFNDQAFAAASLGQVHDAISQTNEQLAVKVQYPGIDATINSDIQLVKQLVRPMKDYKEIKAVLEEIEDRMAEETNYLLEAENIDWFSAHLQMEQVVIPKVYHEQTSKRVISMQRLDGMHLIDWLKTNPSQQRINQAAQTIYDIYLRSVFELHRFHADPNVGNYLFREDGSIGLIDFGCVKQLSPDFTHQLSQLCQAVGIGDFDKICAIYQEIGVLKVQREDISDTFYQTILKPFFDWYAKPYQQEYFDFAQHRGFTNEGLKLAENMRNNQCKEHAYVEMNKDFVYSDRTLYGLYKMFEVMGATVRMQNKWTCG